ncbi:GntP family permease [Idiomarina loihiensis]|uniref:GntP family permease n=1 Tax=Idiomarina TaxID=135575 RepID=UPI0002F904EF|nr:MULTISPECIES: SLC13 family permease [Idiomarina]MAA61319.1 citrate transporter [Idiomarina sp.]NWO03393.1 GntP family permease [Idiomarinaceae bacterium]MRJ44920.1 GntP family permease [Idiomarina loihiensis]PWW34916.1 H+/gluconate symporter-like permease [Idiomarina loihiensis]TDO51920.1 H+/gluconate symporter-like permease [Idiomarina sp. 017G]
MLSMIGLVGGLVLLIVLTLKGVNLFISAPLCAVIVALCSGVPLLTGEVNFVSAYMDGFASFVAAWFFMFLLGSLFGKFMEDTGAADSVASWIINKLGRKQAVLAVVLACAILTYGGVSVFVVAFSVYPMALSLFKDANLPRRFIPAALAFGSVTFTMTSAGSPEIQNWIPVKYLGTSPYAAWEVSLVVAVLMATFGYWWLRKIINRAIANGEKFEAREGDPILLERKLPSPISGLIPLLVVLGLSFTFHDTLQQNALIVALLGGVIAIAVINFKHFHKPQTAIHEATTGALVAIGNTAAVVGFGSIAKITPAFDAAVTAMTSLPGNELVGAAVAVSVIAGLTGSASGGQAIALPEVGPHYMAAGVNPEQLHRIVSISSGALDSLPHNGYVVTTIRAICNEKHSAAYWAVAAVTVVVPLMGLAVAIGLFML